MTIPSTQAVLRQIQHIAETELGHDGTISLSHRLIDDLGIDSLGAIVLAVGLEDHFRVRLQEQDAGEVTSVADLIRLVQRRHEEAKSNARRT